MIRGDYGGVQQCDPQVLVNMGKRHDFGPEDIRRTLGAKRAVALDAHPSQGPLDLLDLRERFLRQLRSTGGRPTNPEWEISRSIRFKPAR